MTTIEVKRVDDAYAFVGTDSNGHTIRTDGAVEIGGHNSGCRPMQTLLMGLGGCSGVDIVSILKKQRQEITDFTMTIQAEREQGKEPALWKYIHIHFVFKGNVDAEKAKKACALSIDKYCSVAATLKAAGCTIEWDAAVIPQ
ncbi:OsmC family protein [Hydrotalea sp.]|uniref:OsmC family protein n=1 Tax=Hydrotalea sp. TaxID=2881279 RepID=UPI0026050ED5|nr:OsmC family protein [Hydrotalea sp.]